MGRDIAVQMGLGFGRAAELLQYPTELEFGLAGRLAVRRGLLEIAERGLEMPVQTKQLAAFQQQFGVVGIEGDLMGDLFDPAFGNIVGD